MERFVNVSAKQEELKRPPRRAYERPRILYEGSLEAAAGVCGKAEAPCSPSYS